MKTWRERIAEARAVGAFTEKDIHDAADSWLTCAVGEQHTLYGGLVVTFDADEQPRDDAFRTLGSSFLRGGFGWAVQNRDFDAAERALDQIEDRALQLKRERMPA